MLLSLWAFLKKRHSFAEKKREKISLAGFREVQYINDYFAWCGHWINEVWPNHHKLGGTGIMVVNVNKSTEELAKKTIGHIVEIAQAKTPRNEW